MLIQREIDGWEVQASVELGRAESGFNRPPEDCTPAEGGEVLDVHARHCSGIVIGKGIVNEKGIVIGKGIPADARLALLEWYLDEDCDGWLEEWLVEEAEQEQKEGYE